MKQEMNPLVIKTLAKCEIYMIQLYVTTNKVMYNCNKTRDACTHSRCITSSNNT
jgi:hypothetical protein